MIQKGKTNKRKQGKLQMIKCHLSRILGEKRLHISDLHKLTGIRYATLWNIYHEKNRSISYGMMEKICNALDCQPADLFTREPEN